MEDSGVEETEEVDNTSEQDFEEFLRSYEEGEEEEQALRQGNVTGGPGGLEEEPRRSGGLRQTREGFHICCLTSFFVFLTFGIRY